MDKQKLINEVMSLPKLVTDEQKAAFAAARLGGESVEDAMVAGHLVAVRAWLRDDVQGMGDGWWMRIRPYLDATWLDSGQIEMFWTWVVSLSAGGGEDNTRAYLKVQQILSPQGHILHSQIVD